MNALQTHMIVLAAIAFTAAGCGSGTGSDNVSSPQGSGSRSALGCTEKCHNSSNAVSPDPLLTNGTGTAGKHIRHVQERGIACERCHSGYANSPTHMNGTLDTRSQTVNIVTMDIVGPKGSWVPGAGLCSGVACHGTSTMDWYGTTTWTTPACTICHSLAFSSALDPAVTNGTPPAGRHEKHVTARGIACERCHDQYPTRLTHMNGRMDAVDPTANLMQFNIVGTSGTWTGDTGASTGQCANISCHGTSTVDWYGTTTWTLPDCSTCHSSGFSAALDPVVTNGTPPAGRHVMHVTTRGIACERCHDQYPTRATHMNGRMDAVDPTADLMQFNIVGTSGTWTGDTGTSTGQCANISCHGTDTLAWYGNSTWTLPAACTTCHAASYASELDPLITGGSGTTGKHEKHVTIYNYACSKCHLNYPSRPSHANGVLDTEDPSAHLVWFDVTNPTGTWVNDTGSGTGACSSLYCHGLYSDSFTYNFFGQEKTVSYAGNGVTLPSWYATGLGCSACHANPPTIPASTSRYIWHSGNHGYGGSTSKYNQCELCHPDATGSNGQGTTITNPSLHANGAIDVQPAFESTCFNCH
jgi:predicted CxxxxCH...CXXCH cytochrome family protein